MRGARVDEGARACDEWGGGQGRCEGMRWGVLRGTKKGLKEGDVKRPEQREDVKRGVRKPQWRKKGEGGGWTGRAELKRSLVVLG